MVAPEHENVVRVKYFISQKQCHNFNVEGASVDVVSQKKVLGFVWGAVVLEDGHQIKELAEAYFILTLTRGCLRLRRWATAK